MSLFLEVKMTEESTEEKPSPDDAPEAPISTFFERKQDDENKEENTTTTPTETVKSEITTDEATVLDKKKAENKKRYQRSKEKLLALRANQIHGCELVLFNINNKLRKIIIQSEKDYIKLIEDLVGTLKDNQMLADYLLTPY